MGIRIHPSGQGHMTNVEAFSQLEQCTPRSSRKAQDVLVAAKRYLAGPTLFKTRGRLIKNLQKSIYELKNALLEEKYQIGANSRHVDLLFSYLSEFSDACPNWQAEYSLLNRFIPQCF